VVEKRKEVSGIVDWGFVALAVVLGVGIVEVAFADIDRIGFWG